MKTYTKAWINKDFHKLLKRKAAEQNKTIIELTEELAKDAEFKKEGKKINNNFWKIL